MVLTVSDITDLKDIQRHLETERRRAQIYDRMKMAFITNIGHEIRDSLNMIGGFSGLLVGADNTEEKHTYSLLIEQNNQRLLDLFENMLDLSRIESGEAKFNFTDFSPDALLDELYAKFAYSSNRNPEVGFRIEHSGSAVTLHSERERVDQVLSILLYNAMKTVPTGEIVLGCRPDQDRLHFYVSDTGPGISSKIFRPLPYLYQPNPVTGLELLLSQLIVDRLGGTIGVESQPGQGSTFWFTLPVKAQQSQTPLDTPSENPAPLLEA